MTSPSPLATLQKYWLLALLVLIPFSLHYVTLHPAAISYLNFLSLGFIAIGIISMLTGAVPRAKIQDKGFIAVIGGLFLVMAYGLLFTHPLRDGIGLWGSRLVQPFFVGYFSYQLLASDILNVNEIVEALFLSLIPLGIGGALQVVHILPYQQPHRVTVLYQFANTFARYVMIILTLSLPWLLVQKKQVPWRVFLWILGIALLVSTVSYDGVVCAFLAILLTLLLLPRRYRSWSLPAAAAIVVTGLIVAVNAHDLPKWQTSITSSRVTRLEFWAVAWAVIKQHVWTGIGLKGWQDNYGMYVSQFSPNHPPLNYSSLQPQNVFLDSLLKAGIPGLIGITAVLVWPITRAYQVLRSVAFEKGGWFGLSMLAYGTALLLFGIIDDPLWSDDTTPLLFILFFALSWIYISHKRKTDA